MRIDTLGVEAFVAIADEGSFGKAAERLHLTQTALTRRLQNFEALLGVTLVERTTRSVALSAIGAEFLPEARRLLGELGAALLEIHERGRAHRGEVSIACVPTVGVRFLPRIIEAYAERFPDNRVRILDHASSAVADAVLRREAEFGIQIGGAHHPELTSLPLLADRFVLLARSDHPLAAKPGLHWADLRGHPLIFVGAVSGNRPILDAALARRHIELDGRFEVQHSSTAVGLAAAGVAPAVVPSLAVDDAAYPDLRVVALTDPTVTRSLVLVRRRTARLSPAAEALHDLIRAEAAGSDAARPGPVRRGRGSPAPAS
jgi:DNA-binding transcriptional LysR family regulator